VQCPTCQHENAAGAKFCGECGARLAISTRCAACGAENPPSHKFCNECGEGLERAPAPPAPPVERDPRDYTPKHLADRILTSKSALEGERKQVTVLFADVSGSVDLSEQVDAEEWHRILDRFFRILSDGVHRFEGTVNQYTGDGIMALFGAPIAHEDHAQRACYAALYLRDELRRYADELRLAQGLNFSVRMGLNSGEVVVGKIGDDLRMDYTAQGHTVGLAARMEQLAESGRAYATEHTAGLVEGYFQLRDLGPARARGSSEPVRVYELEGPGRLRTRLDVSRSRGLSRFVGRGDEMAALEAALERAVGGQGHVVGVVAEAGIGKSRLCFEFAERCRARGVPVREAHGVSHGKMIPFLPVLELLRGFFEIDERDGPQVARNKIAGALLLLERTFEPALPLLFDFLGVPDPERPSPALAADERERRILAVIARLLELRSERQPGVMLVEDLHWIDGATEAFLASTVELAERTRTLLLVNFRPEYRASWMQRSSYQQVPLRALGGEAVGELLRGLLGEDPSLAGLPERIRERTGGNPFFVEETVQTLVETGSLEGTKGAYRLAASVDELALPASVQAVLAARIDRLAEREKQVLHGASVLGEEFGEETLRGVMELPAAELERALRELASAEFVFETALYPEREYAFKHPLTREVAYGSQLKQRRARLHAAAARALEARESEEPGDRAALLAHHYERAGEALPAAHWHRRAAEWTGLSRAAESFPHWLRVRELADGLPASRERDELGALARAQLLTTGARIGSPEETMGELFREGEELARRSGNRHALARLLSAYGIYRLSTTGSAHGMLEKLEEAVALMDETDDVGWQIATRYNLAIVQLQRDPGASLHLCDEALERIGSDRHLGYDALGFPPLGAFQWLKSLLLAWMGRFHESERIAESLLALARENPDPAARATASRAAATGAVLRGEGTRALELARTALEAALSEGAILAPVILAQQHLGDVHLLLESWDEALAAHERARALIREHGTTLQVEVLSLSSVALARLGRGEVEPALTAAEEAVSAARERRDLLSEVWARLARAAIRARKCGPDARTGAEQDLERSSELIARCGIHAYEHRVLELRAELARAAGDGAERERLLREAHRRCVELGATGHARRLAREVGA
jgi:class 3 adenylate cyclase/tetratricopeptide (TPR) repeat protein